ncbi:MAG TPA: nickel ABC transporter permease [Thermomicrobiaceae bacterium]|nr:nickel ABC transporter permease [Thermomicrobiaceae bacterium]
MYAYLLRRILVTIPVMFGVLLLVFSMLHLVPGDPVKLMLSEFQTSPQQIALVRAQLHLDEPLPEQFGRYVWGALHGDLGYSIRDRRPVSSDIMDNLPSTLELALAGMLIAALIGVTLGIVAAIKQNSWADIGSMFFAMLGVSMPSFWLGLILIFAFSLHIHFFPAVGANGFRSLVLPAVTLGLGAAAIIARLTRSSMLEILHQEYVTTARAKGVREWRVIVRHALKNALIPVVTIFGLQFGQLLAGTVVIETVFGRPGIGRLIVDAILAKDFPVVQGVVLVIAVSYVVVNLLVDLTYVLLDPRIRYA